MVTTERLPGPAVARPRRRTGGVRPAGVATMLAGSLSSQVGAATGAHAFGAIGPAGVVAVRQVVAALVLLPVARPSWRAMTWSQWWPCLLLAAVFATMNLSLYSAVARLGLGTAVTLEFLGPLAVALGAGRVVARTRPSSRNRTAERVPAVHLLTAALAATGVYVLVMPGPASDVPGIALGLVAATCWAAYIGLNRTVGARLPGLQAPATAAAVSATAYLPVLGVLALQGRVTAAALAAAVAAGLLSSAVPYAADLVVLRTVPPRVFGVFMSMHPVWAALVGLALLGQALAVHAWAGLVMIVTANAVATTLRGAAPSA